MDELNALPYLDAVVREILRVHAPVRATSRIAAKDDIIPLSIPITDRFGRTHDHVKYVLVTMFDAIADGNIVYRIDKGTDIIIPIQSLNTEKALWGDDSAEFRSVSLLATRGYQLTLCRPERWYKTPEAVQGVPGVWGNMLTFLGGPRACIGYRFALVE